MRILASCPRAYRRLACGAGVPETCHPTAGHTAGETGAVLAGIRSRSLRAASIANVPRGKAFSVKRSGSKEVWDATSAPSLGMYLIPVFRPPYMHRKPGAKEGTWKSPNLR